MSSGLGDDVDDTDEAPPLPMLPHLPPRTIEPADEIDPAVVPEPASPSPEPGRPTTATTPASTRALYRSEDERRRSLQRRANPWWRRLARGAIAFSLLAATGVGLYVGARLLQGQFGDDDLPEVGAEIPHYRSTSFQVGSTVAGTELNGTLTLDSSSGAFEFVGRPTGPQAGVQVISRDGQSTFVRRQGGDWRPAPANDELVRDLRSLIPYLTRVDTADDVLPKVLRDDFVELGARTVEGEGPTSLTRFEMTFDTAAFADRHPAQWESYRSAIIPGIEPVDELAVTIWLDVDGVVVRFRDETTGWTWERLTYSDTPFVPIDPTAG